MSTILHITSKKAWLQAIERGSYRHDSLDTEEFIHCSYVSQVVATANRFFQGQTELILLEILPSRVSVEIKEEEAPPHGYFPHIYGELNVDAVVRIIDFEANEKGEFELPRELS
ncbi:MAG: DUF952 domain-containing protein [Cyanobacteria bacterium P01_E01_bin.42]